MFWQRLSLCNKTSQCQIARLVFPRHRKNEIISNSHTFISSLLISSPSTTNIKFIISLLPSKSEKKKQNDSLSSWRGSKEDTNLLGYELRRWHEPMHYIIFVKPKSREHRWGHNLHHFQLISALTSPLRVSFFIFPSTCDGASITILTDCSAIKAFCWKVSH